MFHPFSIIVHPLSIHCPSCSIIFHPFSIHVPSILHPFSHWKVSKPWVAPAKGGDRRRRRPAGLSPLSKAICGLPLLDVPSKWLNSNGSWWHLVSILVCHQEFVCNGSCNSILVLEFDGHWWNFWWSSTLSAILGSCQLHYSDGMSLPLLAAPAAPRASEVKIVGRTSTKLWVGDSCYLAGWIPVCKWVIFSNYPISKLVSVFLNLFIQVVGGSLF